jgi:hypothetical protein
MRLTEQRLPKAAMHLYQRSCTLDPDRIRGYIAKAKKAAEAKKENAR